MSDAAGRQLILYADAMCSWCYGFWPAIDALVAEYGDALPIRLINGGLQPYHTKTLHAGSKASIRGHWQQTQQASGQPFDYAFFDREGFVYDTEPASRSIVAVRDRDAAQTLPFFKRVQRAFYAENRDVTDANVLASLAAEFGVERPTFLAAFAGEQTRTQTQADFEAAAGAGITNFPTLIAKTNREDGGSLITDGYQPADRVLSTVAQWLAARG